MPFRSPYIIPGYQGLHPKLNAFRDEVADERLRGHIMASMFVKGKNAWISGCIAPCHNEPRPESEAWTYLHYGEVVQTFGQSDDYVWCQSERDNYVGYVHQSKVTIGEYHANALITSNLANVYNTPSKKSVSESILLYGSRIITDEGHSNEDMLCVVNIGYILRASTQSLGNQDDILEAAYNYMGVPYLWGGRSILGIDCSGLVQQACERIGIMALRDADMQAQTLGHKISFNEAGKGDLLFLPGHVGIMVSRNRLLHADGISMKVIEQDIHEVLQNRSRLISEATFRRVNRAVNKPLPYNKRTPHTKA